MQLRNPYVDPLNYLQVEMLRRLRALPDAEGPDADECREVIVLTINGIAAVSATPAETRSDARCGLGLALRGLELQLRAGLGRRGLHELDGLFLR